MGEEPGPRAPEEPNAGVVPELAGDPALLAVEGAGGVVAAGLVTGSGGGGLGEVAAAGADAEGAVEPVAGAEAAPAPAAVVGRRRLTVWRLVLVR